VAARVGAALVAARSFSILLLLELYPAIDIHKGQVVRASRSDLSRATLYDPDPFAVADRFVAAGARWVHVVDLDRAFGVGDQTTLVAQLVKHLNVPVQLGGGLWTADDVAELRDCGVQRVLLGSRAAADEHALAELADQFAADCLGLAIDVENGRVWSRDWPEASGWKPEDLARRAQQAGITTLVVTELGHEGKLKGADVDGSAAIAKGLGMDVIVSGGVDGLEDLRRIESAGLAGAIVGRALFEKRFTLEEALASILSP
jgi:phosphoribosylformimino-5-aminoimidazole carboxamide ribotide isomerase